MNAHIKSLMAKYGRKMAIIEARHRNWNNGTVRKLALGMREGCEYGNCPMLADALEEAEFSHPQILRFLRHVGPTVRAEHSDPFAPVKARITKNWLDRILDDCSGWNPGACDNDWS